MDVCFVLFFSLFLSISAYAYVFKSKVPCESFVQCDRDSADCLITAQHLGRAASGGAFLSRRAPLAVRQSPHGFIFLG